MRATIVRGLTGCQWAPRPSTFPDAQLDRCQYVIVESSRSCVFLSISQPHQDCAGEPYPRYCLHDHEHEHKEVTERGLSVWRRQSQFSPVLGFALEPFIDAVKPISHHGEDDTAGRRLSATLEFFPAAWRSRSSIRSRVTRRPQRGEFGGQREASSFSAMASSRVTVFQFLA